MKVYLFIGIIKNDHNLPFSFVSTHFDLLQLKVLSSLKNKKLMVDERF